MKKIMQTVSNYLEELKAGIDRLFLSEPNIESNQSTEDEIEEVKRKITILFRREFISDLLSSDMILDKDLWAVFDRNTYKIDSALLDVDDENFIIDFNVWLHANNQKFRKQIVSEILSLDSEQYFSHINLLIECSFESDCDYPILFPLRYSEITFNEIEMLDKIYSWINLID